MLWKKLARVKDSVILYKVIFEGATHGERKISKEHMLYFSDSPQPWQCYLKNELAIGELWKELARVKYGVITYARSQLFGGCK